MNTQNKIELRKSQPNVPTNNGGGSGMKPGMPQDFATYFGLYLFSSFPIF